jgi:NAD(P)-dependent dehydrogenase (short-subunit alcohol dehydrogenase family)
MLLLRARDLTTVATIPIWLLVITAFQFPSGPNETNVEARVIESPRVDVEQARCPAKMGVMSVVGDEWLPNGDCSDKVYVITGGNSGIGLQTTRALATCGATIYMLSHNVRKGDQVAQELSDITANKRVDNRGMDLGSFASVRRGALALLQEVPKIDALICNSGVGFSMPGQLTTDGFIPVYQINFLGHALLTELLLPKLRASKGRVIMVSSSLAQNAIELTTKEPQFLDDWIHARVIKEPFTWQGYDVSKLGMYTYATELARREREAGRVLVFSAFPGTTRSRMTAMLVSVPMMILEKCATPIVQPDPCPKRVDQGATTTAYLATQPDEVLQGNSGDAFYLCTPKLGGLVHRSRVDGSVDEQHFSEYATKFYAATMQWIGLDRTGGN